MVGGSHHRGQASLESVSAVTDVNGAAWMRLENLENSGAGKPTGERSHSALIGALDQVRKENEYLRATVNEYKKTIEYLEKKQGKELATSTDCPPNFYEQLRDKVESPSFLQKLEELKHNEGGSDHPTLATNEEGDLVNAGIDDPSWWVWVSSDLFGSDCKKSEDVVDGEYVLVSEDDIIEGIATFMARYITSIPRAKNMTPKELQDTIATAFKNMEKKGHLWRLWQMGRFLYSAASWGTTAIGLFKHPIVLRAMLMAVSTSIRLFFRVLL